MLKLTLGPKLSKPFPGCSGSSVRISDDVRKMVVFLGYRSDEPGKGGIDCFGTGVLLFYDDFPHLLTVRHVAEEIGDNPFLVRLNKHRGDSENIDVDQVNWHFHEDPNVDIAVTPFNVKNNIGFDSMYFPGELLLTSEKMKKEFAGIGDFCYTVGLFRLLAGRKRNLPVVHFGTIALVPGDEKIPVADWRDPTGVKVIDTDGYLVESQSLDGLSGAPVFVRPTVDSVGNPPYMVDGEEIEVRWARKDIFLLGLWQGAWALPPDHVLGMQKAQRGEDIRVSVGMGVVVPADKIKEALDYGELKGMRDRLRQKARNSGAVTLDVARVLKGAPPESDDANPNHLEDFKRLVDAAARKRPQGGQT